MVADALHQLLGLVPVFGEVADVANGLLYLAEGNTLEAGLAFPAVVPIAGAAVTGAKFTRNATKAVRASRTVARIETGIGATAAVNRAGIDNIARFGRQGNEAFEGGIRDASAAGRRADVGGSADSVDLFHGTTAANAASIRGNGINLTSNTNLVDFGAGFYTTNDRAQAARRAAQVSDDGVGEVLHFRIPRAELEALNGRTFTNGGSDWASLVRGERSRGQVGHGYDFVEGPFVSNPRAIDRGGELIPKGHQLSVHTQTAASLLDRSLR